MKDNITIQNLRSRRNGFIGTGLKRTKLGEEEKGTTNNQFIASLIMNTNLEFYKHENKENSVDFLKTPLSPSKAMGAGVPISPKHYDDPARLFSPKKEEGLGTQNKFMSYMTGATAIQKFNNSTNSGSGNYTNSMILSPTSHTKNQTFGKGSTTGNSIIENVSSRRYVANVIKRDLFRNTFMNAKQDYNTKSGIKEEPEQPSDAPSYRKFNL